MTEEHNMVLSELADHLVGKYGAKPVLHLAELIRDPQLAEKLADELERATTTPRQSKARSKTQRADRVGMAVLKELRLSDPEKHAAVAEVRSHLLTHTILPSMNELRNFAFRHNLSIGKASSRKAAIAPFLRSLSQLSTSEILSICDSTTQSDVNDRSLDRWRDVIVSPRPVNSNTTATES